MRIAQPKPNTYPMHVADIRGFHVGAVVVVEGYRYQIVSLDDATSTLFVRPAGQRRERRAAVRAVFK